MSSHSITSILSEKFSGGIDISDASTDAQILSNNSGQLTLQCSNDLKLDVNNASIVELTPSLLSLEGESVSLTATTSSNTITGGNVGIYSTTGGVEISAVADSVNVITPQTTWFNLTTELTGDGSITCSNINAPPTLPLTIATDDILYLNSGNNTQINAVSSFTATAGDNIILTATNDAMTLSADDDVTISSVSKGILINAGTGDAGTNDIILTTQNATLQGLINLQSGGDIQLNAPNGAVISINSGDNTQVSCGENLFIQTNISTGVVILNTGDLANGGGVVWNNYPMGITFFNKWNGTFSYNTPNNWELINPTNPISFPSQFLNGTWAVSFSLNCWNAGSAPSDKGLAVYFNFIDGNSNTYTGFNYRQQTPFANWFNASGYTNTSQQPLSITYTDYFDFTGAVNNLQLQINWYGDQSYPQEFNLSTTFTLMTLIS